MTIVAVSRQAPWLGKTIKALVAGAEMGSLPRYAPRPTPPILVPLGPKRGTSVLPVTKSGVAVGGFLTSMIKGKFLFIPRYREEFGNRCYSSPRKGSFAAIAIGEKSCHR